MPERIRVLIVDDHEVVRAGTRGLLERNADFEIVGEAGDGAEAVAQVARAAPDVVLMDVSMPGVNGIDATRQIKRVAPRAAVLALSAYDDDPYVFALLEAGAAGYLLKNVRAAELADAVRAVAQGESVLHPTIARKVVERFARPSRPAAVTASEPLTDREMDVLRLAGRGLSNKKIARELVISARTVQVHLANVFAKLEVGSRTEAILYALRQGWITLEETDPAGPSARQ